MKYRQKDLFPNTASEDVNNDQIHFSTANKEEELYCPRIVFSNDCFCLRAALEFGDLFIRGASKRFTSITGYSLAEVTGSPVSVLMGDELRDLHL